MRVKVDHDRCEGNAVCLGIAPDIFDLDDEDYAVVKADPGAGRSGGIDGAGDRGMPASRPGTRRLEVFIN